MSEQRVRVNKGTVANIGAKTVTPESAEWVELVQLTDVPADLDVPSAGTYVKKSNGRYEPLTAGAGAGLVITAAGTGTLEAGSATISAPITATSRIQATYKTAADLTESLQVTAAGRNVAAGTFVVTNGVGGDSTSTFDWLVIG